MIDVACEPSPRSAPPQAPRIHPSALPMSAPLSGGCLRSRLSPAPMAPTMMVYAAIATGSSPGWYVSRITSPMTSPIAAAAADGDQLTLLRIVVERQPHADCPERRCADEWPDHPGEESGAGSEQ